VLLTDLVDASSAVAATRSRLAKVATLAGVLRAASGDEAEVVATFLGGALRQRRTGLGHRSLRQLPPPAASPTLTVAEVDAAFEAMAGLAGAGSAAARAGLLDDLMGRATAAEQRYLTGLAIGEVRQGALDGLLLEAVAAAADVPAVAVRRASMLAGSTPAIARAALTGGEAALAAFGLAVGVAVRPMLAASAASVAAALPKAAPDGGPVAVEAKLDGIRLQAHKDGDAVRLYTRSLDDVTGRLPEIAAIVRGLPVETAILDGEALALDDAGRPRPFQETAASSATHADRAWGLTPWFFDALLLGGVPLIDRPLRERRSALDGVVPPEFRVEGLVTPDAAAAEAFCRRVLAAGHEGVVVKNLDAPYAAGRRGSAWVKVKPVHTLDLVVLAVEWGSGRRRGWLSNIHLGARDPATGGFTMLGKTFKGMTDAMLAWQTERFLGLADGPTDGWVVRVRPEQVVEIAFDGLQRSTRYPGGLALRFARVVRYRDDKTAAEADTIGTVRALAGAAAEPT
jgi:DNA ligase-1